MDWEPRWPLTAAENHVDFPALLDLILGGRERVERAAMPTVKRLTYSLFSEGFLSRPLVETLTTVLERELAAVARGGFDSARSEIRSLRENVDPVLAYVVPDAGDHADISAGGLTSVRRLLRRRAAAVATAVAAVAVDAYRDYLAQPDGEPLAATLAATVAVGKQLHNHVLELVGEALNLGRSAGVLTLAQPPEFSQRSEQLDKRTCDHCSRLHGQIAKVGAGEYFNLLPPQGCLGGGRCRAVMIFADRIEDVRAPEPSEEELERIRREAQPSRRAA